ncbi:MAG: leucine-rich repeat domain-containing protein [Alphaproteobacteria bacterium]|nr:leucine-rich repeat domain-containing protein [Alphaproteobacteria bacterium]
MKHKFLMTTFLATTALATNAWAVSCPDGTTLNTNCWSCGDNCTASLVNGKMTISGTGPMTDYTYTKESSTNRYTDAPWFSKISQITSVEIESGITTIGLGAFQKATNLTSVSIPNTVTTIRDRAFESTGVVHMTLPDSVQNIDYGAFYMASSLQSINIPSGAVLGDWVFEKATSLSDITLPMDTTVGRGAFKHTAITSLDMPANMTLGVADFDSDPIKHVTLPEGLVKIPEGLFAVSDLETVVIPSSVKEIDKKAFNACENLQSVTLPDGLESIGYWAFRLTPITEITIPDTVKFIADEAFNHCMNLTSVTFSPTDDLVIEPDAFHDLQSKISSGQITFNCAGDIEKCRAKLRAAGYNTCTIAQAAYDIKDENGKKIRHMNADGTYYDYPDEVAGGFGGISSSLGKMWSAPASGGQHPYDADSLSLQLF